jgi:hypothetical protein
METNVKFRIAIVELPQGTSKENHDKAVEATETLFDDYQNAELLVQCLPCGVYRIAKYYYNVLS